MEKYVMSKRGFGIETILIDGYSEFRGKPEKYFIDKGYKIIDESEFDEYYNDYIDSICGNWKEISKELYYEALEVLPPLKWYDGGFFISEATFGDAHCFYQKLGDRYYSCTNRISKDRSEILEDLKVWLRGVKND